MAELAQYIRMQISIHAPREGGDRPMINDQ